MRAKVTNFGLVRLAPDNKASLVTRLAGSFGYLAPKYAVTGQVTQQEDSVHLIRWFRDLAILLHTSLTTKAETWRRRIARYINTFKVDCIAAYN